MQFSKVFRASIITAGLLFALAACSTLNPVTAVRLKAIDFLTDDIGSIVLAIDVPFELVPVPAQSHFDINVVSNDGQELGVKANLVRALTADISAQLPPPKSDRAYFLFEIEQASQLALKQFQRDAEKFKTENGGAGGALSTGITLKFCATARLDPTQEVFSAFVTLPGDQSLQPMLTAQNLGETMRATGEESIPSCADIL